MKTKTPTSAPAAEAEAVLQFPGAFTLFKPSIQALWRNIFTILEGLGISLTVCAIAVLGFALGAGDNDTIRIPMLVLGFAAGVVGIALLIILTAAMTALQVKSAKGKKVSLTEAYEDGKRYALRVLGLNVILTLVFLVSFLLLVVPFLFMMRRYYLAPYFLVDRNLGVFEAMKLSASESKRYSGAVWGLVGVEILISILGFIPLIGVVVGTLADLLYSFAPAVRYVQIEEATTTGRVTTGVDAATA